MKNENLNLKRLAQMNVAACFILIFFLLSIPSILMPIMYSAIMEDMGWTYSQISAFSSWKFLSGAITSIALGLLIDKISIKKIVMIGTCLSAIALMGMSLVSNIWIFYIFGFALGVTSVVAAISCRVLLSRWYSQNLGRMVGIAFTGGSLGGVVTPLLGRLLIDSVGWQSTAGIFGGIILVVVLPVFWWLVNDHPQKFGSSAHEIDGSLVDPVKKSGFEFNVLVKTRTFWLIFFAHFLIGGVNHTLMEHTALFIENDLGFSTLMTAGSISLAMLASIIGKVGFGWLFDRYSMHAIGICWYLLAAGIGLALLVSGPITMILFVIIRGSAHGGILVDPPCIALHNFGIRSLAKTVSMLSVASMLGAALSTATVGYSHDLTGSYYLPFLVLIGLALVAGTIAMTIKPAFWQAPNARKF